MKQTTRSFKLWGKIYPQHLDTQDGKFPIPLGFATQIQWAKTDPFDFDILSDLGCEAQRFWAFRLVVYFSLEKFSIVWSLVESGDQLPSFQPCKGPLPVERTFIQFNTRTQAGRFEIHDTRRTSAAFAWQSMIVAGWNCLYICIYVIKKWTFFSKSCAADLYL